MSAQSDILSGKFKSTHAAGQAKRAAAGGNADLVELFANFVGYAAANWNYVASPGSLKAQNLLASSGAQQPACGTLREALMILIKEELKIPCQEAKVPSNFMTKPGLECFDPKVKGNVGNNGAKSPSQYGLACVFSKHFFLSANGKYYDPCLKAVYTSENGPVAGVLQNINGNIGLGRKNPPMMRVGNGRSLIIRMNERYSTPQEKVPGFGSTWKILLPKECKDVLDAEGWKLFKKDPFVKASGLL